MFEKSLFDLIKGLRQHKGNEKDYIEHSLRECRREVKGSDMDLKAIALLKLTYLEMFGYDMSWASFNILEVMSAPKHHQKRIGYLGAVQTFGPNTDVLMLATNLLKKDIVSSALPVISLPLVTIPHLVTPGLANAVVPDLLARMSHSSPNIRKKSVVTLYRLALVWPEAFRPVWPRMKEILEDDAEDPSVTAATVNVICELVWRRPEDFLPLAPRLFDLLIHGGNNWMSIKLIKLFATLTPLEPRLIKKLAPALTNLINTTMAMSVLYECVNGIIQGGILEGVQGIREGDEIAELCVNKLRGMVAVEGDPNLKYVALLAFNKIVISHPQLISVQQDVIVPCLDDGDISIRMQALNLVSSMVDAVSLPLFVSKLLQQLQSLKSQRLVLSEGDKVLDSNTNLLLQVGGEFEDYGNSIIQRILDMCSRDLYRNMIDFDWYIDVLIQLVGLVPITYAIDNSESKASLAVFDRIGSEIRSIAVRVKSARSHAVEAVDGILSTLNELELIKSSGYGAYNVLNCAAFIAGEYPGLLPDPSGTINILLLQLRHSPPPPASVLTAFIQAIPKILGFVFSTEMQQWNRQQHYAAELLLARMISSTEPHTTHENIDVQEHAVTLLELAKISEAALAKHASDELTAPILLREIIPALFTGQDLNPVAASAQRKVQCPSELNLDMLVNSQLISALHETGHQSDSQFSSAAKLFYSHREIVDSWNTNSSLASERPPQHSRHVGYDVENEGADTSSVNTAHAKTERAFYDPFYISSSSALYGRMSGHIHDIVQNSNGVSLDIDSIPIVELDLGSVTTDNDSNPNRLDGRKTKSEKAKTPQKTEIAADETLDEFDGGDANRLMMTSKLAKHNKLTKAILQVDSSNLSSFSSSSGLSEPLWSKSTTNLQSSELAMNHDDEMKKALAEVERLRLEMQRAQDRVAIADDIPQEGTLIAKKRKKKRKDKKNELGRRLEKKKNTKESHIIGDSAGKEGVAAGETSKAVRVARPV